MAASSDQKLFFPINGRTRFVGCPTGAHVGDAFARAFSFLVADEADEVFIIGYGMNSSEVAATFADMAKMFEYSEMFELSISHANEEHRFVVTLKADKRRRGPEDC